MTDTLTIEILNKLIAFPTVSRDSNLELMNWVENFLDERGFTCHRVPDPTGQKAGLFARIGPEGDGGIMLSAHSDVVPVDGQDWASDPFRMMRQDGRLYGRGACDMKGFLACMLALADQAAHLTLREPFKLAISYDEEFGCLGINHMIEQLAPSIGLPKFCIVGEPTNMTLVTGHKGKSIMRAVCRGTAGHSSLAPQFQNALYLAADLMVSLRSLQNSHRQTGPSDPAYSVPYSTLHVGKLEGGAALNMVPETATLDLELRHLAQDPAEPILDALRDRAAGIAAKARETQPKADIELIEVSSYPGLEVAAGSEIIIWITKFMDIPAGSVPEVSKVSFGTEAGSFAKIGVPSVVCGPGSIQQAHKPNEYIEISELNKCDAMLANILSSIASD
ncbi:acetylornithine deacetylase (plasmid) [Sulfitobacter sp. W027]|uniref:acetylornithine deacetylase n=1 Tax=Sulfitobacter sp. W027 TaxID=2867025 RepID=UPI0021A3C4D8|nr:acetylornithine deacetylase [Sulfitobacter sp. W027]UWR35184.1 acetylornithine deacetylase [Sulfitobacter sp. W027]